MPRAAEYPIEKFAKSFIQPIESLFRFFEEQEGTGRHGVQVAWTGHFPDGTPFSTNALAERQERVRARIRSELNRQVRHFNEFFSAVAVCAAQAHAKTIVLNNQSD